LIIPECGKIRCVGHECGTRVLRACRRHVRTPSPDGSRSSERMAIRSQLSAISYHSGSSCSATLRSPCASSTRGTRRTGGLAGPELTIAPSSRWPADRPSRRTAEWYPGITRKVMLKRERSAGKSALPRFPVAKTAKLDCRRDDPYRGQKPAQSRVWGKCPRSWPPGRPQIKPPGSCSSSDTLRRHAVKPPAHAVPRPRRRRPDSRRYPGRA
jgi:hypothetical protein